MYIPNQMKKKIADTFYDKTISVLARITTTDIEGGVTSRGLGETATFKGNVNFSNNKLIKEEYGLDYDINISITTDYDNLELHSFIGYEGKVYEVTDILPFDSHILIVGVTNGNYNH